MPAARVAGTVARLRAEGHQILRVRPDASTAASQRPTRRPPPIGRCRPTRRAAARDAGARRRRPRRRGRAGSGGGPVSALVRMRLAGFLRTGRALAPLLAGLIALGILYGGGRAQPAEAYGVSRRGALPGARLADQDPAGRRAGRAASAGAGDWSGWPGSGRPGCSPPRWPALVHGGCRAALPVAGRRGVRPVDPGDRSVPVGLALGLVGAPAGRTRGGCSWRAGQPGARRAAPGTASRCWPSAGSARWCSA